MIWFAAPIFPGSRWGRSLSSILQIGPYDDSEKAEANHSGFV